MKYSKKEKKILALSLVFAMFFLFPQKAGAMHIMEGYLPLGYCLLWTALCIPFLAGGVISIRKILQEKKRLIILLAMSGAFSFVLSSLKIPSVTGSSSHMTGTGLSAILFGPAVTSVLGLIVLAFQALLLAHGGVSTLGANTFSMAVAGPIVTWLIYKGTRKARLNKKLCVFLAAFFGDIITYCITALQLATAYPAQGGGFVESAIKFLGVFAPTQLPLAVIEGLITVLIVIGLESFAAPELAELSYAEEAAK